MTRKKVFDSITYEFQPISWYDFAGPYRYLSHFSAECGRLGINDQQRQELFKNKNIIGELEDFLDTNYDHNEAFEALYNLAPLDFDRLEKRCRHSLKPLGDKYAKPRIDIIPYITQKDNLSIRWQPTGWCRFDNDNCDWQYFLENTESAACAKPMDELMFIRNVGCLDPGYTNYGPYIKYNKPVVDAILICAVRACFNQLIRELSRSFEVTLINNFEFIFKEAKLGMPALQDYYVTAWKLYNITERESEQEAKWFKDFKETYGISPEDFLNIYQKCLYKKKSGPTPQEHKRAYYASKAFKQQGLNIMTEKTVETVIDRLKKKHDIFINQSLLV